MLIPLIAFSGILAADAPLPPRVELDKHMKPEETEYWTPVPAIVSAPAGAVPSDAIVLFDGHGTAAWRTAKGKGEAPAPWSLEDGALVVKPGTGDIATRQGFGDVQLHLEFREPTPPTGKSQGRGNSGVFFMGLYELQVLDSYQNPTYVNGQAGSLYKQSPPLVNPNRPPGVWQTYDAVFIAPRFAADGSVKSPARLTAFMNGVLVQYDTHAKGPTMYIGHPHYIPHPEKLPLVLQEHHNAVAFRNIWIRELKLPTP